MQSFLMSGVLVILNENMRLVPVIKRRILGLLQWIRKINNSLLRILMKDC